MVSVFDRNDRIGLRTLSVSNDKEGIRPRPATVDGYHQHNATLIEVMTQQRLKNDCAGGNGSHSYSFPHPPMRPAGPGTAAQWAAWLRIR